LFEALVHQALEDQVLRPVWLRPQLAPQPGQRLVRLLVGLGRALDELDLK